MMDEKEYLEKQLHWIQQQQDLLDQIELKLRRMKKLVEEVKAGNLDLDKKEAIKAEFNTLQQEVEELEKENIIEELEWL